MKKVGTVKNVCKHVLSIVMTRDAKEIQVTVCHAFQTVPEINATVLDIAMILIRTCALTLETVITAAKLTSGLTVIKCVQNTVTDVIGTPDCALHVSKVFMVKHVN